MATLAEALRLPITNYDTVPTGADGPGGTTIRGRVRAPEASTVVVREPAGDKGTVVNVHLAETSSLLLPDGHQG